MHQFNGYRIETTIYSGDKFVIYHAIDEKNHRSVYLKALRAEYPELTDIAQLQREYELIAQIESPEIIKCYGLIKQEHQVAMVMEDIQDGTSLDQYLKEISLSLDEFLTIAINITLGLIALSEQRIIHKDIKPSNIIISLKNLRVPSSPALISVF